MVYGYHPLILPFQNRGLAIFRETPILEVMAEIVNLNQFRKAKNRAEKKRASEENTVKFGRTKAEKKLQEAKVEKLTRDHDGHQLDD